MTCTQHAPYPCSTPCLSCLLSCYPTGGLCGSKPKFLAQKYVRCCCFWQLGRLLQWQSWVDGLADPQKWLAAQANPVETPKLAKQLAKRKKWACTARAYVSPPKSAAPACAVSDSCWHCASRQSDLNLWLCGCCARAGACASGISAGSPTSSSCATTVWGKEEGA